jgi:hypothetical protein
VQNNGGVLARLAGNAPGIVVILLEAILVDTSRDAGLVQSLDGGDNVGIASITLRQFPKSILGLFGSITLLPSNGATLSTIIESVLGSRS